MKQVDLPPLVLSGKLDRILDTLTEACVARQRILREQRKAHNLAELTPGTRVRITRIKPRYLSGLTGEVLSPIPGAQELLGRPVRAGFLPVKLDVGRVGRYGPMVHVPASALERE
jgi:hypothetical protein